MSKLTKSVAYARALSRELQGARASLVRFAPRLGLEIREVNANSFDGALVRARDIPCGVILIRKSIQERGRKHFTLAHELGHYLLPNHDHTELACTKSDIGNWSDGSKQTEREADEFAAELLMPLLRSSRSLAPRRRRCKQSRKLPPGSRLRFPPPHGGTAISRENRAPSCGAPTGASVGRNVLTPLIFVFERARPFTRTHSLSGRLLPVRVRSSRRQYVLLCGFRMLTKQRSSANNRRLSLLTTASFRSCGPETSLFVLYRRSCCFWLGGAGRSCRPIQSQCCFNSMLFVL